MSAAITTIAGNVNCSIVARILLACYCGVQGCASIAVDMNRTHACHPQWTGHARFHVVWQTATTVLLAFLEVFVLLANGPWSRERFYLCAVLAALPMVGFFAAMATRKIYGGALSDRNGIPPLIVKTKRKSYALDMSIVAETAGLIFLFVLTLFFQHASGPK